MLTLIWSARFNNFFSTTLYSTNYNLWLKNETESLEIKQMKVETEGISEQ